MGGFEVKKKTVKVIVALAMSLTMALTCAACGGGKSGGGTVAKESGAASAAAPSAGSKADGKTYELTWAGIGSTDAIDTWICNEISARVAKATDDKVQIKVYPASQLGDLSQAYDEVISGSIDMGFFTIYGNYDINTEAVYTPYMTTNYDEFRTLYSKDGFLYKSIDKIQQDRGVKLLGFWPSGYLGIGFTKLTTPEDKLFDFTTKKDELIRVPSMDTMMASAKAMGFKTTTINYSDVYTSLQTGVCDGSWNGGAYANYQGFRDVLKYYVDYKVCNDVYSCVMNSNKLASLPQEYQDAIIKISDEVINEGTEKIAEQEEKSKKDMADYGIKVIEPTDEQRAEMQKYFFEKVLPGFSQYYGEDFMNQLLEEAKKVDAKQ